jgi:hypothetical protein
MFEHPEGRRRHRPTARALRIAELHRANVSPADITRRVWVSHPYVHQVIRNLAERAGRR